MTIFARTVAAAVGCLALAGAVEAHHSAAIFDRGSVIEVEGTITEVQWVNPHVRLKMRGAVPGGQEHDWDIESNSVSIVSRFGLTEGVVPVGVHVKVAGNGGRGRDDILWITNMLLPDGKEVLFGGSIPARWSNDIVGRDIRGAVTADTGNRGLFRVWTNAPGALWNGKMSLTAAAEAARRAFDPVANDPTANCTPKGMPYAMEQPYPIEFVDRGDEILLKLEEYDAVRHLATKAPAASAPRARSPLGDSVARWDGQALVVTTKDIDSRYLNATGIPLGKDVSTLERFELNADGSRLDYTLTVTDPITFTEPAVFRKSWDWRPGEQVKPYDCRRSSPLR